MLNFHRYNQLNLRRHPVSWIKEFLLTKLRTTNIILEFSKYYYEKSKLQDRREIIKVHILDLEDDFLSLLSKLNNDEELALNSRLYSNESSYHIPMIDFHLSKSDYRQNRRSQKQLQELSEFWKLSFKIYLSGRSFHAYGNDLLSEDMWIKFMGSLLLLNKNNDKKLIDERWVGHRILGGYSALRWSNNTSQYKKYPEYVDTIGSFEKVRCFNHLYFNL